MSEANKAAEFEGWGIVELMGHRRIGGYVREATIAGAAFLRVDLPERDGVAGMTQFYQPSALYCLTPCSEEAARAADSVARPQPINRWELPHALPAPSAATEEREHERERPSPCPTCGTPYCEGCDGDGENF